VTLAHTGVSASADVRQGGQNVEVEIAGDAIVGRPTEIVIRAANPSGDANQGSITVSLPGNPNVEIVGASAPGAKLFQPGEPMFNFGTGRNAPIEARAVELFVNSWPAGARHELRLRVTATAPYSLQARASFRRGNGSFVHLPANGQADQQGAPTRLIDVTPRQPAPPTAPPAPPTAARPPPTNTVAPPTDTPVPPTQTPIPPSDQPAPGKPTEPPAAAPPPPTAGPTSTVPGPPAVGPVGASTATPAPTPGGSGSSTQSGPSIPLLLAGFGIMAVGVAVALVALLLVLRRRSPPPPRMGWPNPAGPYPGAPFMPGGTARMPAAPATGPGGVTYGTPAYPGSPPPWSPPAPGRGGSHPDWPLAPSGPDPARGAPPPWERPPTPAPPRDPREAQHWREPPPEPTVGSEPTRADVPPAVGRPPTGGNRRDDEATPRPTSVEGSGGSGAVTPQGERYTERVLVGRGGMGSVYRAYDSRLRRWVALKIMHADLGLRPGFIDRFIREAQMAAMLEHPNIVTVYDIEPVGDSIQMVMSWIEGRDLQQVLEREGALAPDRVERLLTQMAAALDHAHLRDRPILHRDIKPSNIMIGPNERVILTDFGIARLMGDVSLTQTGQMVGTPAFMAPEVVQGAEADARADVYALGVVLYQMLTGQAPFQAQTPLALLHAHVHTPPPAPRTVVPTLPPGVDQVLARALAKDPNARFQTAGTLAWEFRSAIGLA
jgi:hypothetical protein